MSADDATVIRGSERRNIPATDIVPGDIILIEEGDTIPADARVVESTALQTAEAASSNRRHGPIWANIAASLGCSQDAHLDQPLEHRDACRPIQRPKPLGLLERQREPGHLAVFAAHERNQVIEPGGRLRLRSYIHVTLLTNPS
jgi:hypothetical protein